MKFDKISSTKQRISITFKFAWIPIEKTQDTAILRIEGERSENC